MAGIMLPNGTFGKSLIPAFVWLGSLHFSSYICMYVCMYTYGAKDSVIVSY